MSSLFASTQNTRFLPFGNNKYIRSDCPSALTDAEVSMLREYHITTVIDLREESEYTARPCRLETEPDFVYHHLPVTGGGGTPASPEAVARVYISMLDRQMDNILRVIHDAPEGVLYFCTAGKDRTGVVSAVLLRSLGVDDRVIVADYMRSKENLLPFLTEYLMGHPNIEPATIIPNEENIRAVLNAIDLRSSSVEFGTCI